MSATSQHKEKFEDYDLFVEKFKPKKTTDDCYTPANVYDAVLDYAISKYGISDYTPIVRPFYPGGDYENYDYPDDCVVIDNPPFSILSKIITFYTQNDIKFFLFAPALTLFGTGQKAKDVNELTRIGCGASIVYENGAKVSTSFITNLGTDGTIAESAPELYKTLTDIQKQNKAKPKYEYSNHVLNSSNLTKYSKYGVYYKLNRDDAIPISRLDSQKEKNKSIYGKGYLLSDRAAADRAAADRAAADRAAADRAAADRAAADRKDVTIWNLSDRELELIAGLSRN